MIIPYLTGYKMAYLAASGSAKNCVALSCTNYLRPLAEKKLIEHSHSLEE